MIVVNEYFDGKVKSIGFTNSQGKVSTGVMDIGEYVFSTQQQELMQVMSGALQIKQVGQASYTEYKSGTEFEVAANSEFAVIVKEPTAYLCFYR
ncbi:MAG: pyrimidine/purine nucleoside phosphorylase [Oceanospirillaceae bacterium]